MVVKTFMGDVFGESAQSYEMLPGRANPVLLKAPVIHETRVHCKMKMLSFFDFRKVQYSSTAGCGIFSTAPDANEVLIEPHRLYEAE